MTHDAPVTWMPIETAPKDGTFILLHEILAQPPVSVGCYDHECGWLIAEADFMPSKCSPRHWMPLPAAPVDESEDWRKAWREVALLSSEHEDVRLNEAVAELHRAIEAYAHPPVADRVSTPSPVADRETPETSDKLRDAVEVWEDAYRAWDDAPTNPDRIGDEDRAAAAIIEQDREAVRAEQAAEIERLRERLEIDPAHSIDGIYARDETIRGLEAELAKYKALAETLAGALEAIRSEAQREEGSWLHLKRCIAAQSAETLRQYKEARDAS